MGIADRITKAYKELVNPDDESTVYANGMVDKRDIEDPTVKYSSVALVRRSSNIGRRRNVQFRKPEYDLPTIANAVQLDGILRRSVNIFVEQILKNGFEITTKNDRLQKHINKRITEIEKLTGVTLSETLTTVARQLVTYGNCYLVKSRSGIKSRYGNDYRLYGKDHKPIVGLFVAEAACVEVGLNNQNHIVEYKQDIRGNERTWDARDIIHLTYNKIPGTLTGMSSIIPILDDVRALRKLEEEVEILGFQYAIPLYLYKIGNKDNPPGPGEIEAVRNTVNNMPSYGMLVVPGHHDISVPTNNNSPLDLISFINHFKRRIFAGLGVSPIAMGEVETSNRNTSEVLELSMQSITQSYQSIIKQKMEMELIRELILDGNLQNIDAKVEFNFPEIDMEAQIKKETHIIAKWQNNLVTRSEARLMMDHEAKIAEKDTFLYNVEIPLAQAQASAKQTAAAKNSILNKNQPANQHGRQNSKPKIKRDHLEEAITINDNLVDKLIDEYTDEVTLGKYKERTNNSVLSKLRKQFDYTINTYNKYYHLNVNDYSLDLLNSYLASSSIILDDKITRIASNLSPNVRIHRFHEMINRFILDQGDKISSLAKVTLYKSLGYKTILINAEDCELHSNTNVDISEFNYSKVPPNVYGCKCKVDEESLNDYRC